MTKLMNIIIKARGGDVGAFEVLVRRFRGMVVGYAYGLVGERAEDVAQEAFLEAFRELPRLRHAAAFTGLLRKLVVKHADRMTRKKSERVEDVGEDVVGDRDPAAPGAGLSGVRSGAFACAAGNEEHR